MATIPDLTRTIDDEFTHTWYTIRAEAIDNILGANVLTAALREKGCFKKQVGEKFITRTMKYGVKTATAVAKGDTLPSGEDKIETMAMWRWKYIAAHIQRSYQDDQQNNGPKKIKSLVGTKIQAARDALNDKFESSFIAAVDTGGGTDLRAARDVDSIYNMLPAGSYYNQSPGTYVYGGIDTGTGNSWHQGVYKSANDPPEVHLLDDMKNIYNTCGKNQDYPNLILTAQTLFEIYESFALDQTQIIKGAGKLADLGYEVLKFKGKDIVWSEDLTAGTMFFFNTDFIDVVYDPQAWFDMTHWKDIPLQLERIAHIICTLNLICSQLRRQGFLGTYT